jgi:hypothetical protein
MIPENLGMLGALGAALVTNLIVLETVSAAQTRKPSVAQVQVQSGKSGKATTPMERCLEVWDPFTRMTKQEWRATCKRTVRDYPDLYKEGR